MEASGEVEGGIGIEGGTKGAVRSAAILILLFVGVVW